MALPADDIDLTCESDRSGCQAGAKCAIQVRVIHPTLVRKPIARTKMVMNSRQVRVLGERVFRRRRRNATLTTNATMIAPMKNWLNPIDSAAL